MQVAEPESSRLETVAALKRSQLEAVAEHRDRLRGAVAFE